jgi:hypothetical protein
VGNSARNASTIARFTWLRGRVLRGESAGGNLFALRRIVTFVM